MTSSSTPDTPADDGAAISQWTDLVFGDHTAQQRAWLDAAWSIADVAGREIAAARREPPEALPVRGSAWCRIALTAYHRLMADATRAAASPPPCVADADRIRAWLAGPSTDPGFESHTVAQAWGFDEIFTDDGPHNLTNLVDQAQQAGAFGVPGHQIVVWYLPDADPRLDGFLVTVDTPTGRRYCSDFLGYTDMLTPGLSGVDAALDCLTGLAATVDEILDPRPAQPAPGGAATATATEQAAAPPSPAVLFGRPSAAMPPPAPIAPPSTTPGGRHR